MLPLPHKNNGLTAIARRLVHAVYEFTPLLPPEGTALSEQLRKSALLAYVSIASGCHQPGRKRRLPHFREAEDALVRLDAAFELIADLRYTTEASRTELEELISTTFTELKKARKKRGRLQ